MDFDLRDVRFFQTIADIGHLGRAAEQLGRSQPALTKCIKRLEASLGADLFERKGRGIQLTPAGRVLLAKSRPILNAASTTFREIKDLAQGRAGHLRIGSGPITAEYLLPSICRLILSRAPGVTVEIDIGTNHFLREQLRRREIDLIAGLVRENDAEFSACPLIEDVVVVAAGRSHPIFQFDHPTMENLLQYAWILPISAVASRQWLNKRFELQGLEAPRAQIEVNSIPMLSDVISGTEMLCFVSRRTLARPDAAFLREVSLEMTTLRRSLGLSYLGSEMSPAVQKLIALVRKDRNWID